MKQINVIKRDGSKTALDFEKINKMLQYACDGLSNTSPSQLAVKMGVKFYDGITTTEIHDASIRTAVDMIDAEYPNYQFVAARLMNYRLRKNVYGTYEPVDLLTQIKNVVKIGFYDPEILEIYTEEEINTLNKHIKHERDEGFTFAAMKEFEQKYLVRNRENGEIFETPQHAYMLIAMTLFGMEKENRMKLVVDYYNHTSSGAKSTISLPTPLLAGVRTPTRQFSSCVVIKCGDTIKSINATSSAITTYVSKRAGIGVDISRVRPAGSSIRNGEGTHTGLIPFIKHFATATKAFSQGMVRCLHPDMCVDIQGQEWIPIDQVVVGDYIKTVDEDLNIVYREVTDVMETDVPLENQYLIEFENGTEIICSDNHPIMVLDPEDDCSLIEVYPMDLKPEHQVVTDGDEVTKVWSVKQTETDTTKFIDITVDESHTFFTKSNEDEEDAILTHNSGSSTLFYSIWNQEIEDLVVLKNNRGSEDNRERRVDYGIQINGHFYKKAIAREQYALFNPNEVPDLYEAFFRDQELFEKLYDKYSKSSKIKVKWINAFDLFQAIVNERIITGRVYIFNVDNINHQTPFKSPVYSSNLCLSGETIVRVMIQDTITGIRMDDLNDLLHTGLETNIKIASYNEKDHEVEFKKVTASALTAQNAEVIELYKEGGASLFLTPEHRVYVVGKGYVEAQFITPEDELVVGPEQTITGLQINADGETTDVYDITVEDNHNFFANGLLVHNCLEIASPTADVTEFSNFEMDTAVNLGLYKENMSMDDFRETFGEINLCTLSAFNLGNIKHPSDFEYISYLAVRALDNLLSYQHYPMIAAEIPAKSRRNLGIGIINLAHWLAKRGYAYGEGLEELDEYMEAMYFYLMKANVELAAERGACAWSSDTKYSDGVMIFDLRKPFVDTLVEHNPKQDWDYIRSMAKEHGVRHSVVCAMMPSECQSKDNMMLLADGSKKTVGQLLVDAGVDVSYYEDNCLVGERVNIKPFDLPTGTAYQAYYNGPQEVFEIKFEDGNTYKFTGNHKLLVKVGNNEIWKTVSELDDGDDIVSF